MSEDPKTIRFFPEGLLSRWMADRFHIWQMRILNANAMASFAHDRGCRGFSFGSDLERLWQIGLFKADLVESSNKLEIEGLELLRIDNHDGYLYSDVRSSIFPAGLSSIATNLADLPNDITLHFHPFRFFVLHFISEMLHMDVHPKQQLLYAEGYPGMLEQWQIWFSEWTRGGSFLRTLGNRENITELAIATEPWLYSRLFGQVRYSGMINPEEQDRQVKEYWQNIKPYYKKMEVTHLEDARQNLCLTAEMLDPNKNVHTILRLTSGDQRIGKVKGVLGGAMCLLTMAEMIRRATEDTFDIELPEEDERGFGITYPESKQAIYGSRRVTDGNRKVSNQFLRSMGLDHGLRVRWYVEGDTEYNAFDTVIGRYPAIELINLRGRVSQKGDKGVSFRDSLRNDLKAHIFSLISLDSDNEDYVRAIRTAAENDEICGMFFVAEPDFEFANFSLQELEDILWAIAMENGVEPSSQVVLHDLIKNVDSGRKLINAAQKALPELSIGKGALWGQRLMKFAYENPEMKTLANESIRRPILDAVDSALRAVRVNYIYSRTRYRVDPKSGYPVKRSGIDE